MPDLGDSYLSDAIIAKKNNTHCSTHTTYCATVRQSIVGDRAAALYFSKAQEQFSVLWQNECGLDYRP